MKCDRGGLFNNLVIRQPLTQMLTFILLLFEVNRVTYLKFSVFTIPISIFCLSPFGLFETFDGPRKMACSAVSYLSCVVLV